MKNTVIKLLCLTLVLSTLLTLSACSLAFGTYKLDSASMGGLTVSLETIGMDPDECYLEMTPFGTAVMVFQGEEKDMKYGDGKIWPADDEDDKVNFEIDGDTITIEMSGVKLIFKK